MWVLNFFICSLIVWLLLLLLGGTLIGYYFTKRREFEAGKIAAMKKLFKPSQNSEKQADN